MSKILQQISKAGVSVYLDDLSRERIVSGSLGKLIEEDSVVGVTTNPAIFASAISKSDLYRSDILKNINEPISSIMTRLITDDVRDACDILQDTFTKSAGADGRVSLEVDPSLARDAAATVKNGISLWNLVDRKNLLIKVPATTEALPAITNLIEYGICVNITLIFSVNRYKQVLDAFASGLEKRLLSSKEITSIHSVASFFISRIDSEVDTQLGENSELKGVAAISNAAIAYHTLLEFEQSERWKKLAASGANLQRPLWASTGVKNPDFDKSFYVLSLVARNTINTMPESTLRAVQSSGVLLEKPIISNIETAKNNLARLALAGIDLDKVTAHLELDGIEKFQSAWLDLTAVIESIISDK